MNRSSMWAVTLTAGALGWMCVLLIAPMTLSRGPRRLAMAAGVVYEAAGAVCHQRPERSFRIAGVQQPVCARCAGLYVSGALGALVAAAARRRRVPDHTRTVFVVAAIPTLLTVTLEFTGAAHSSNLVRAVCALPLGSLAGWLFVTMLNEQSGFGTRDSGSAG